MIAIIVAFLVTTFIIAATTSIWSTLSDTDKKYALKLFVKSALYSAIAVGILSLITFLF